jgi:hypothetical protein
MSAVVEGVHVENPTAVWMQLKNTRQNVLKHQNKWNPGGWYERTGREKNPYTMCLANALRFVVKGTTGAPREYSRETVDMDVAERLVLKAINSSRVNGERYYDIPNFNDEDGRRWQEVVAVIEKAIEWIAPHAKAEATVFADEVMSPEEMKEIRTATRKAEDAMWGEYARKWDVHVDERGVWRDRFGSFARKPPRHLSKLEREAIAEDAQTSEFKAWLNDHEARGWDTFWDELLDCGDDKDCQGKVLALA